MTIPSGPGLPLTPRRRSPVRIGLAIVAVVLGLYTLIAQILAIVPVGWTQPVLRSAGVQAVILAIGWNRALIGSWNPVIALVAVLAAAAAAWGSRSWSARTLTAATGLGLALALITSVTLVVSAHSATGKWMLFGPAAPLLNDAKPPDETVVYATLDGRPMHADLYLPAAAANPAPLVVSIHGGAFIAGSRGSTPYTRWLAEQGYAVLDVDYRLSSTDDLRWNTQDADVGCALTWAMAHAQQYRWDPHRVVTFGGSAGGSLAVNVAYKIANGTLKPSCGTAGELPRIRAVIGMYPAVELAGSQSDTGQGAKVGRAYLGGTPAEYPARYAAADSPPQIGPHAPPTLLVQGRGDHLVFASRTRQFADRLTAAGITHRYVEFPFVDHGYDAKVLNIGAQAGRSVVLDWLRRYDEPPTTVPNGPL
ncbi:alpha/beta hydrolase [Nocardia terpenica]|uniref:Peptidase n=1 Tax=Nocardia terpenica TaxID=455432 RepID=A0A164M6I2_9NOCA|nr:alpha/beta hydrolase [Nocardia terpenica]KZM73084.1 peptidase [Nocardia terpenica]NQE91956.1 alpha/beta hydrolase [Nocardia terpenica]